MSLRSKEDTVVDRLLCPSCGHGNLPDAITCEECRSTLVIGYLESDGDGVIPGGYIVPLCRRSYRFGRQLYNDVVIPCQAANSVKLRFDPTTEGFVLMPPSAGGICLLNLERVVEPTPLTPGDYLKLGIDTFTYIDGTPPDGVALMNMHTAQDGQFVLNSAFIEIAGADDLNEVCAIAVDAVLKVTRMDRGVFFLTDTDDAGELVLRQCVTRATTTENTFTDVDSPFRISQSLLQQSLQEGGAIVIDDARKRPSVTESMVELQLNSLACLPIVYNEGDRYTVEDCLGIIYADSFIPTHDVVEHAGPLLTMLASYVATTIMHWRQPE